MYCASARVPVREKDPWLRCGRYGMLSFVGRKKNMNRMRMAQSAMCRVRSRAILIYVTLQGEQRAAAFIPHEKSIER